MGKINKCILTDNLLNCLSRQWTVNSSLGFERWSLFVSAFDIKRIENHCGCRLDENQHPPLGGSERDDEVLTVPAGIRWLSHFKHMATELWGLVVLLQLGQSHGRLFPAQVPLQRALKQQLSQQLLILGVQVGAQAVDLGDVAGQVLVNFFGQVAHL